MYPPEMLKRMYVSEALSRIYKAYRNNPSALDPRIYKVTKGFIEDLLIKQDVKCGICGKGLDSLKWDIDHCHETNKVRGLLCHACNIWLGKNEGQLLAAWVYVRRIDL